MPGRADEPPADTQTLLWWLADDARLSLTVRGIISDRGHQLFVSSASAWEIATKYRLGKLASAAPMMTDMSARLARKGFEELPVSVAHGQRAGAFPQPHRDPFDRMLAAQSLLEDAPLVTNDAAIAQFGVTTVW